MWLLSLVGLLVCLVWCSEVLLDCAVAVDFVGMFVESTCLASRASEENCSQANNFVTTCRDGHLAAQAFSNEKSEIH